ncbi:S-methyl-5-thioribose kinase [Laceyella putida]|uniref:Methylthioribose kinase n=1 Tax=Laceyella putida TaxID=110101 RepID=A0ABW2RI26_9BACL
MSLQTKKPYEALTTETVVQVVAPLNHFDDVNQLEIKEIGDGNLNYVFHLVEPATGKSLIVKQALPYAKVVGESWPLTLDRARIESEALIKAGEYVPALVPKVYHTDRQLACTVMEDLSDHLILRKGLIQGEVYPKLAEHIATFLAQTLFHTSDFFLHPFVKKEQVKAFINPELCKITEDLVFTDPFFNHDTNDFPEELKSSVERLWNDQTLKRETAKLKHAFLTRAEALLHGDLHTGSIFVTTDSTKVIDPEFAYYGPIGFDIGQFFANLALSYLSHFHHSKDQHKRQQFQAYLLNVIEDTWTHFTEQFSQLWHSKGQEAYMQVAGVEEDFFAQVLEDAIGFAGCEVIRRTIGLAHVADLDSIEDQALQLKLKEKALALGSTLVRERKQLTRISRFLETIRGVAHA